MKAFDLATIAAAAWPIQAMHILGDDAFDAMLA
jgi:hypothetical protein